MTVALDCAALGACAAPAGGAPRVGLAAIAIGATDVAPPTGSAYLASEPVRDRVLRVRVSAHDAGAGLGVADVRIDGALAGSIDLRAGCADLQPGGTLDLAIAAMCPADAPAAGVDLSLAGRTAGTHDVSVIARDAVGNAATLLSQSFRIDDAPSGAQQTVAPVMVGTGTPAAGVPAPPAPGGSPDVPAADTGRAGCVRPRLSVVLASRPKAVRGRVLVLRRGRRVLFRGRVTCVVDGRRVPAGRGTGVEVESRYPRQRRARPRTGPSVRARGRFVWSLLHMRAQRLTFRVRPVTGPAVTVSFRLAIR